MALVHHFLIPSTHMNDPRFFDSVLYICRHSSEGAWGFIINQPSSSMSVGGLLGEMHIDAGAAAMKIPAMNGGVIRPEAGFVLHTGLPKFQSSFAISENVCLTTSRDILPHLAPTAQFAHYLLMMGFCSWGAGQLEQELQAGDWLSCPADSAILFHTPAHEKLALVHDKLGLGEHHLAPIIGQA